MYLLVSLSDVVKIHPADFNKSSSRCIEDFINTKYADKVIHKVGLCLGFHSLITMSEGLIGHGTGIVNVNVDFRVIVFRPFKGEIVLGTITHSAEKSGISLSQDFFEDIVVPPETLFDKTAWGKDENGVEAFIWHYQNEDMGEPVDYFFDRAEPCLYRVEEEQWHDLSPQMQTSKQDFIAQERTDDTSARKTPYRIRGSMMLSGLGPTIWWMTDDEAVSETLQGDTTEDAKLVPTE